MNKENNDIDKKEIPEGFSVKSFLNKDTIEKMYKVAHIRKKGNHKKHIKTVKNS